MGTYQCEVCWEALKRLTIGSNVLDGHLDRLKSVENVHCAMSEKKYLC